MTRRFSLFNAADAGAGLVVENGGTVLTTESSGLNINRTIRSNIPQTVGTHSVTFIVYTPDDVTPGSVANRVSIGIATEDASLSEAVGENAESIGYRLGEGTIRTSAGTTDSVASGAIGAVVKLGVLIQDDGAGTVSWRLNRSDLITVDIPAGMIGQPIYWAVSLGSDAAAGDIQVQANSGQNQMEDASSPEPGWWEPVPLTEAVRVSTEAYVSHHDDLLPATRWETGVKAGAVDARSVSFWWWGGRNQVQGSIESRDITDPDGRLDYLLAGTFRDQPVRKREVQRFHPLSEAVDLGLRYFDNCVAVDDLTKRITLKDIISLLELRLQDRFIRPDADSSSANTAWPTMVGKGLSCNPPLLDSDIESSPQMPVSALDAAGVDLLGKVRVKGVPLEEGTAYELIADGQQIRLSTANAGILTLDMSRTGAGYTPPGAVDILDGEADPFTGDLMTGDIDNFSRSQDNPSLGVDHTPYFKNTSLIGFPQRRYSRSHITSTNHQLVAGTRYRWEVTVNRMPPPGVGGFTTSFILSYSAGGPGRANAYAIISYPEWIDGNPTGLPKVMSGTVTIEATHYITLAFEGNNLLAGDGEVSRLVFIELPPLDDSGADDEVEFALPALTLEDGMRMVIETEAGLSSAVWDSTTAAAVDAATGHKGGNFYAREQATRREALEAMMAGYTASIYRTRDGKLAVARAVIPEDVYLSSAGADFEITQAQIFPPLIPERDPGLGLTRQIGCRRNERILSDAALDTVDASVSLPLRAKFARQWRSVMKTGAPLAPGYEHADAAEPLDTRLMLPQEAQAEADFMARAYRIARSFYSVSVVWDDAIDLMAVGLVKYNRYGMQDGIPMVVVEISEDRDAERMDLTLWGPSPYEDWQ